MRIVPLLCLLLSLTVRAQVWEPLNGPLAVEVSEVEVNSSGILFFNTQRGLHRSADNGDTWELLQNGLPASSVAGLFVAPNDHVFVIDQNLMLYRSLDDGLSWSLANNGQSIPSAICIGANAMGVLFIGKANGQIARSYDDGDTWTSVQTPADELEIIAAGQGDTLYAGGSPFNGSGSIVRSTDGGNSWITVRWGTLNSIAVNAFGHVFAGMYSGLIRSLDGGTTWTTLTLPFNLYARTIWIDGSGDVWVCSAQAEVVRSSDNGDTWTTVTGAPLSLYAYDMVLNQNSDLFMATNWDFFRSTDGGLSWSGTNDTYALTTVKAIAVNDSNHYFMVVEEGGVYRSLDAGASWHAINLGLPISYYSPTSVAIAPNGHVFAGVYDFYHGGVYRSTDNGNQWTLVTDSGSVNIEALVIKPNGHIYASSTWSDPGIIRSMNDGSTWTVVLDDQLCLGSTEMAVASNGWILAAGSYCYSELLVSTNGSNWSGVDIGPINTIAKVTALATRNDARVLAARSGPNAWVNMYPWVYRSTVNGWLWEEASFGLDTNVNALICHPTPGLALAGTPAGAFITNNDGNEWWPFSDGLTNMNVTAFAIDQNDLVLAGTAGGGVFRASLPVSVPEVDANAISLEQNMPNPCDGNTTIAYALSTSSHVQLVLLDAHGRTVAQLVDAGQPLGRRTVEVVTARLSPGLYAYSLTVDGQRLTKRMMVVR